MLYWRSTLPPIAYEKINQKGSMALQLPAHTPAAYEKNLHQMLNQFHHLQIKLFFIASNHAVTRYVLQLRELQPRLEKVNVLHAKNSTELLQQIRGLENKAQKNACGVIVSPYEQLMDHFQGYEQVQYVKNVDILLERLEKQGMLVVKVEN